MSLSNRLRNNSEKRSGNNQFIEPLIPGRPAYETLAGVVVDDETAIRMSTVYSCIRLLSDTVSSLPVNAYVRRGRERLSYAAVYGEVPNWVQNPNPETTKMEFYEQIITSFKLNGNAFILLIRDDNDEVMEIGRAHV
jgi:phage portal protein BeeE